MRDFALNLATYSIPFIYIIIDHKSTMIKKIGIECHNLEKEKFGVGQTLLQFLKTVSEDTEAQKNFRFVLYFNKKISQDPILNNPIFERKLLKCPLMPPSFSIFYHILLPIAYLKDRLDGIFLPSYMMPAFLFWGKNIAVLTNDVYYESHQGNLPFKYKIAYRIFSWLAAKQADRVMTISEFSKKELARLYNISAEKISVVSWGLNDEIKPLGGNLRNSQKIAETKYRLGIKNKFILSVGQAFSRRKVKESMLAFEKIASQFPNIQYVVACVDKNNPPLIDNLAQEINKKLGREAILRIDYLSQEDILCLFNSAELLVYISSHEAMGLPPMEALKCGTVPLVADNELTHEIFGENAFFVKDIDDPDAIAVAMIDAMSNTAKRTQIIKEGQVSMQRFSWPDLTRKLLRLFKETFHD